MADRRCAACGRPEKGHSTAQAFKCAGTLAQASSDVRPEEQVMLAEEIAAFEIQEQTYKSTQNIERLRRDLTASNRDLKRAMAEQDSLRNQLDMVNLIDSKHTKPAPWAQPKARTKGRSKGIPSLLLSDLHLDEIVEPSEIEGLNAYSRDIAEQRLKRTFEKAITTTRDYMSGVSWDGFYLYLGGDLVSGFIHEELAQTNETTIPATVDYWLDPLAAGIGMLADHYGKVHIAGVVGNHGRLTNKPRAKKRVQDNIDWLIMRMLIRDFRGDDRITWQVPNQTDVNVQCYDTRFLLTHGDQQRGGSGIAGAVVPWMMGRSKKTQRAMATDQRFDIMLQGHWHQYFTGKGLIVNGSTKGYDEYAYVSNFDFEIPRQAMWITTPEHGVTFQWPVICADRKKEGW